ncbi:hypothetical protein [Anaerobranca gottschalkii]|uniref:Uncharacterized protein n=1 Tax=Anaerobranca gottschalkii DSM 13577 TaxID=1120990 RepID=A0A1H9Y0X0_9FIRM|nr:hypothetical protein [Anaerobranca gottschalkii]SES62388.1 hypothetical protein SAMN03080614_100143 [Anaerobranca gottschalkii DSM 13577]
MNKTRYKILLLFVLVIFIITTFSIFFFRPKPSDEEIPPGSKRVNAVFFILS